MCVKVNNHSRDRHGSIFDGAEWDAIRQGPARCVQAWRCRVSLGRVNHGNHLHGRRGRGFDAARWDELWSDLARFVAFCLAMARRVGAVPLMEPPSCWHGGRSTRPWWDASWFDSAGYCGFSLVAVPRVAASRGTASSFEETTLVQARFPIDAGGVGFSHAGCLTSCWCSARHGGFGCGALMSVMFC
jgi:hypothetical protein